MRTCLAVVCGLVFLLASSLFFLVLNLNQTVYNASFDKKAIADSGIYQSVPEVLSNMVSNGQISVSSEQQLSPESQKILIETIKNVITPEILKKHSESIIDQTFSGQMTVREDLSDINYQVNQQLGDSFSKQMGIAISANPDNTFVPGEISFDKNQNSFGKSVIYHTKVLWALFITTLLFLVLLFIFSAKNYKQRLKWLGWFLAFGSLFTLINFFVFRLSGFDWLIRSINTNMEEAWMENISSQAVIILTLFKLKIASLYLYESIILTLVTIISFVVAAILPAPKISQTNTIRDNLEVASKENNHDDKKINS